MLSHVNASYTCNVITSFQSNFIPSFAITTHRWHGQNGVNKWQSKVNSLYDHVPGLRNVAANELLAYTHFDFLNPRDLGLIHMTVKSLVSNLDSIRV